MIYTLTSATKDYIWGGTKLIADYNKPASTSIVAESWELSCHSDGPSYINELKTSLPEYFAKHPDLFGTNCANLKDFPVLVKLIDAADSLSIQVHPKDDYALKHENQFGKTEMWYIVDCEPDAFLYYGFEAETTKEEFITAIKNNTLCDILHKVNVKKGDVFFIEAGTIHAIGAGCLIAEVQQNSNVTYRVFDYGRTDAKGNTRELHVEKACDVTTLAPAKANYAFEQHLASCKYFTVDLLDIAESLTTNVGSNSFAHFLVLEGTAEIIANNTAIKASKGSSILALADTGNVTINGNCKILKTTY